MPTTAATADSMTNYFAQQMELDANTLSKTIWPWGKTEQVYLKVGGNSVAALGGVCG